MSPRDSMDWNEWRNHVLAELKALRIENKEMTKAITGLQIEFMAIKIKAGMWGAVLGSVPMLISKAMGK